MEAKYDRRKEWYNLQYQEAKRTAKRKTRADKRGFEEILPNQVEVAANKREHGKVFKISKIVCGKSRGTTRQTSRGDF